MIDQPKYTQFALAREICRPRLHHQEFQTGPDGEQAQLIEKPAGCFSAGKAPAACSRPRATIAKALREGSDLHLACEGGCQAMDLELEKLSYSASPTRPNQRSDPLPGSAQELRSRSFRFDCQQGHQARTVRQPDFVLSCGKEDAVAATRASPSRPFSSTRSSLKYMASRWRGIKPAWLRPTTPRSLSDRQ